MSELLLIGYDPGLEQGEKNHMNVFRSFLLSSHRLSVDAAEHG